MNLYEAHLNWANRPSDERFKSLPELHAAVTARDKSTAEADSLLIDRPVLSNNGERLKLALLNRVNPMALTAWSASQLCTRVGVPKDLLTGLSTKLAEDVLAERIGRTGFSDLRGLVGNVDGDEPVLRAIYGERYTRVRDAEVTGTLVDKLPEGWRNPVAFAGGEWGAPLEPSGLYASDRDMFAFFIDGGDWLDLGGNDTFHRGFFVGNSEVGARTFWFSTFYFRVVCGNNIVWDASNVHTVRARHTKGVWSAVAGFRRFLDLIGDGRTKDHEAFAKAVTAAKDEIAVSLAQSKEEVLDEAFKRFGPRKLTRPEIAGAFDRMHEEEKNPKGTRWEWLQGFTAYARGMENAEDKLGLEKRAKEALLVPVRSS